VPKLGDETDWSIGLDAYRGDAPSIQMLKTDGGYDPLALCSNCSRKLPSSQVESGTWSRESRREVQAISQLGDPREQKNLSGWRLMLTQ